MRCRGCRGMGEAASTGWLGVGRPVGPPVPWPINDEDGLKLRAVKLNCVLWG